MEREHCPSKGGITCPATGRGARAACAERFRFLQYDESVRSQLATFTWTPGMAAAIDELDTYHRRWTYLNHFPLRPRVRVQLSSSRRLITHDKLNLPPL